MLISERTANVLLALADSTLSVERVDRELLRFGTKCRSDTSAASVQQMWRTIGSISEIGGNYRRKAPLVLTLCVLLVALQTVYAEKPELINIHIAHSSSLRYVFGHDAKQYPVDWLTLKLYVEELPTDPMRQALVRSIIRRIKRVLRAMWAIFDMKEEDNQDAYRSIHHYALADRGLDLRITHRFQ